MTKPPSFRSDLSRQIQSLSRMSINICGTHDVLFALFVPCSRIICANKAGTGRLFMESPGLNLSGRPYLWLITQPAAVTQRRLSQCVAGSRRSADKCWEMRCDMGVTHWFLRVVVRGQLRGNQHCGGRREVIGSSRLC